MPWPRSIGLFEQYSWEHWPITNNDDDNDTGYVRWESWMSRFHLVSKPGIGWNLLHVEGLQWSGIVSILCVWTWGWYWCWWLFWFHNTRTTINNSPGKTNTKTKNLMNEWMNDEWDYEIAFSLCPWIKTSSKINKGYFTFKHHVLTIINCKMSMHDE